MQSKNKLFYNNKKLKCFYLFFFSILDNNFADEKDFLQEREEDFIENNDLNSIKEEESFSIKLERWNTKKWGSIYLLFPYLSYWNFYEKFGIFKEINYCSPSFIGNINRTSLKILNFLLSGIVEYKWMFHKNCGINFRLNLNNIESYYSVEKNVDYMSFFSLDISFEWIYRRKNKHVWSGSFSPIGLAFVQAKKDFEQMRVVKDNINHQPITDEDIEEVKFNVKIGNKLLDMCTFGFVLLKYEYGNVFYMNLFKIKGNYFAIFYIVDYLNIQGLFSKKKPNDHYLRDNFDFGGAILMNGFSMEFGLNIIGFYDWIKRKIKK